MAFLPPCRNAERLVISVFFLVYSCLVVSVPVAPPTATTPTTDVAVAGEMDFSKLFNNSSRERKHRASYVDEPVYPTPNGAYPNANGAYPNAKGAYPTGYPQAAYPTLKPYENKYPLRDCYTERSGYMCCNVRLESVMHDTAVKMKESKGCNLQKMSTMLASISESVFGTDFEAISAIGDFASKIHFYHNYVCKMERDGRTLLVYATPDRHNGTYVEPGGTYPTYPTYTPYTL
ncbi:CBN-GRD-15 protein [Caenorhabditis brenneri]|uniref:CBN-GRD-15 protein n=1 Tax=Caenorhabditis brenneri TaxID=135651 RepID=G0NZR0_CAEBE|nr:CBN-GRD-15 protein [Caenorhabditis brenneri]